MMPFQGRCTKGFSRTTLRETDLSKRALGALVMCAQVGANLNNLGSLLQSRKEYDRALGSYEQALSIFQEACGGESAEAGVVLCNMGSLHGAQATPEAPLTREHPGICKTL